MFMLMTAMTTSGDLFDPFRLATLLHAVDSVTDLLKAELSSKFAIRDLASSEASSVS